MACLDEMVFQLAPKHVPKHDELFGKGRGRLGYLIYNRITGNYAVDELDIMVERIKNYFEKSKSYLKRGKLSRVFSRETPKQYLNKATLGFLVTEKLSFYSNQEVSPDTCMKSINANPLTIANIMIEIAAKDFDIEFSDKSNFYRTAIKKKVSYTVNKFANSLKES